MNEPAHSLEPMVEIRSEIRFAVSATTRNNSRGTYVRSWHIMDSLSRLGTRALLAVKQTSPATLQPPHLWP